MITIPQLTQLITNIQTAIESEFGVSISINKRSMLRVFAAVQAASLKLYYLTIGSLQKNIFVDTADPESLGGTLERFGRVKLGRNPFKAVSGQYELTITGAIGATIKASSVFKSNDDSLNPGFLFILDNAFTLSASPTTIIVRALTTGTDSKLNVLDKLTPTSPIALVDALIYVSAITVQPLAAEDIETYRSAVIASYRTETQGGAASDYRIWANDAQGVQRVYPYAKSGAPAEVNLYVEATIADSTDGKGTPSGALLTAVEAVVEQDPDITLPINDRGRKPLGAWAVHYLPVTIEEIDVVINGYVGLTAPIQTQLTNAITDLINQIRPFIAAADVLNDKNDILDGNRIIAVILAQTPGAVFGAINIFVNGVPLNTYTFIDGNIPHVNSVTYA
ncbi:MAG TPA: baseplate J/gp47 family protein [Bacteroidia bacterium]|nr:baseplate J/gp47 family protein [Bacteroidia bacterium]